MLSDLPPGHLGWVATLSRHEATPHHSPKCPVHSASFCPQVVHSALLLLTPCSHRRKPQRLIEESRLQMR